ncbi:MAG TPA: hypothetical protein VIH14_05420 [Anaerolineales bacterium]
MLDSKGWVNSNQWRQRVERELARAKAARTKGNEGRARVCARRASGWAVEAYLQQRGLRLPTPSVLDQMRYLLTLPGITPRHKEILQHLLTVKQKSDLDADSFFPLDVDLIAEAQELIAGLFPDY